MFLKSGKRGKIYVLIFAAAFAAAILNVYCNDFREMSNDKRSLETVCRISEISDVCDAAVLHRNKTVLAAVLFESPTGNEEEIKLLTTRLLKESFPDADNIFVAVDDGAAVDILELAYYIDTDISDVKLIQRFNHLAASFGEP